MDDEEISGLANIGLAKKKVGAWILSNIYTIIIAICSVLVLIFVPMIGSKADIGETIPTDPDEAFLYWTLKGMTVALNLAIFAAFRKQAKLNAKDNENFKEAERLLEKRKGGESKPMSPAQFGLKSWGTKGLTLTLSTAVTSVALTNIVLYYDWVSFVSCAVTIAIAIVFGLFTMGTEEYYWEHDFLRYAKTLKGEKDGFEEKQHELAEHPAAGSEEQG